MEMLDCENPIGLGQLGGKRVCASFEVPSRRETGAFEADESKRSANVAQAFAVYSMQPRKAHPDAARSRHEQGLSTDGVR